MELGRTRRYRAAAAAATMSLGLIAAACGSSSPRTPPARHSGVVVGTTRSSLGTYLTSASGRALYIWVADSNGRSTCNGACAAAWPPLLTKAAPKATGDAIAADLGTTTRSDGSTQVTYAGRPLYYYVGDTAPGMTRGQGSGQFGANWWLISPSGGWVTPQG
jgi:predicted lipoprotein with Yx(FWY)xxD motif